MPKIKTHKGAAKRFKLTKNGKGNKIKFRKSCKNHLIKNKSKRSQKLGENNGLIVDSTNIKRVSKLLGVSIRKKNSLRGKVVAEKTETKPVIETKKEIKKTTTKAVEKKENTEK